MMIETEFNKSLPKYVVKVLSIFHNSNIGAWVVGGAVRDLVRGETPHDYDITTEAPPEVVMSIFSEIGFRAFATDKEVSFGRCSIIVDNEEVEITTLREEGEYSNNRHPDECGFVSDLEVDSNRRDFTMNALYLDIHGNLHDFHEGYNDALEGVVRFVGIPNFRINEDHLRILRFFRFCLRFNCFTDENMFYMNVHAWKLGRIAPERVKMEMEKVYTERVPNTIQRLFECGIVEALFGEEMTDSIRGCVQITKWHPEGNLLNHLNIAYNKAIDAGEDNMKLMGWIILLHDVGKPFCTQIKEDKRTSFYGHEIESAKIAKEFMEKYRFSNEESEKILYVISQHMRISQIQRMKKSKVVNYVQDKHFGLLHNFHNYDDMVEEISPDCLFVVDFMNKYSGEVKPLVSGADLIAWGLKPGEHFGGILKKMREIQYENELTTKEEVMNAFFNKGRK